MAITQKQRLLAAARKEKIDRLPFGARIDVWYNYHSAHGTLPEKYKDCNMVEILRDQGAGVDLRHLRTWKVEYTNLEVEIKKDPPRTTTIWHTPLGSVSLTTVLTVQEGPWIAYEVKYPFTGKEDYAIIAHILENTHLVPNPDEYYKKAAMLGEDGLVMTGMASYSPMQAVMRYWIGYDKFFYELHDNKPQIERLFELEKEVAKQKIKIVSELPLEMVQLCANWSDEFHTPLFAKYFVPWLKETSDYFHSIGKVTRVHADGEMKRLIPYFPETGIDVAEGWSPAPMTSVTTLELRKAWGDKVTIWGGIPAILFEPQYTDEEFDDYVKNLFKDIAPGYGFIVGMGDNLPFDGKIERVGRVVELIDKYGKVPIEI